MLVAMSILFHMVEPSLPIPVPGIKLGLANIIGLIALSIFNEKMMLGINFSRVILASLMRGILFGTGFWISLGGVALSSLVAILCYRTHKFTMIGISVASSAMHGLGQIFVLMLINTTPMMIYWLPVLWFSAIPTGILTGSIAIQVLKRLQGRLV